MAVRRHVGRRGSTLLRLGLVVVVASGCIKIKEGVRVNADGSGSVSVHAEVNLRLFGDDPALRRPGSPPPTTIALPSVHGTIPGGGRYSVVTKGANRVLDASFSFRDSAEFSRKSRAAEDATNRDGDYSGISEASLSVSRTGSLVTIALTQGPVLRGNITPASVAEFAALGDKYRASYVLTITAPGSIRTSNADRTQGRRATWELLRDGAPTQMRVTSGASTDRPFLAFPAGAALVGVIAATVAIRRRRPSRTVTPSALPDGNSSPQEWG
jgi:hypothetical protein